LKLKKLVNLLQDFCFGIKIGLSINLVSI
jgi:hypothetical protein